MSDRTQPPPPTACPPHHWLISDPVNRTERWQCLRCGTEHTHEKARPHPYRGQALAQLAEPSERADR